MISFSVINCIIIGLYICLNIPIVLLEGKISRNQRDIYVATVYIAVLVAYLIISHQTFCRRYVDADRMYEEISSISQFGFGELFSQYALNPLSAVLLSFAYIIKDYYIIKSISILFLLGQFFI